MLLLGYACPYLLRSLRLSGIYHQTRTKEHARRRREKDDAKNAEKSLPIYGTLRLGGREDDMRCALELIEITLESTRGVCFTGVLSLHTRLCVHKSICCRCSVWVWSSILVEFIHALPIWMHVCM